MNFSLHTSGEEGLALLAAIKQRQPELPVLLMTAWGSIALAVRGVQAGAANFFTKPWDNTQLAELIARHAGDSPGRAAAGQRRRAQALDAQCDFSAIVGEHPRLLKVLATIGQVAATSAPVLILGESGSGKELIADAIHRNSPRAAQPIVKINMGAITPSLFESEMFGHVRGAFTDAKTDRKGHVASAARRHPVPRRDRRTRPRRPGQAAARAAGPDATSRSAPAAPSRPTSAWCRPPTASWPNWWPPATSAKTCFTA